MQATNCLNNLREYIINNLSLYFVAVSSRNLHLAKYYWYSDFGVY
jgi:hypothetical protein